MTWTYEGARKRAWLSGMLAMTLAGAMSMAVFGNAAAHADDGHPARIHNGSCESLQGVAYRLNGVGGSVDSEGAPVATPTAVNPDTAYQVMTSKTLIDAPINEVLNGERAIMVYESDEAMGAISCGNIGGAMMSGQLITGLGEARIPGHLGFAIFTPESDETNVTLVLGHAMAPVSASEGVAGLDDEGNSGAAAAHDEGEAGDNEEVPHATPVP